MTLESILKLEKKKVSKFQNFQYSYSIDSTSELTNNNFKRINCEEIEFPPNNSTKIVLIIISFVLAIATFIYCISNTSVHFMLYFLSIIFTFSTIKGIFDITDKRRNQKIFINSKNIIIGGDNFLWKDIEKTAIYRFFSRGDDRTFLIIVFFDGTYKKFILKDYNPTGLNLFSRKLSNYIEYFKDKTLKTEMLEETEE